MFLTEDGVLMG